MHKMELFNSSILCIKQQKPPNVVYIYCFRLNKKWFGSAHNKAVSAEHGSSPSSQKIKTLHLMDGSNK